MSNDERYELRQLKAVPILDAFKKWLDGNATYLLPQSRIGEAFAYTLKQWDKLMNYTTNGLYLIDNNPIENSIRPAALGRRRVVVPVGRRIRDAPPLTGVDGGRAPPRREDGRRRLRCVPRRRGRHGRRGSVARARRGAPRPGHRSGRRHRSASRPRSFPSTRRPARGPPRSRDPSGATPRRVTQPQGDGLGSR